MMECRETWNNSHLWAETMKEVEEITEVIPSSSVQFWTFLIAQIPSLACTIFLLYHLLLNRKLRQALHNHIIIILLLLIFCIEVFDNPLYIDAYRFGGHANSFPITSSICLMWWLIDFGFYGAISVFLAWGSFERHILVFHHHQLLRTRKQKFFIHYLPLIVISVYLLGFYIGVIFFPPCENTFDYGSLGCGLSPCYGSVSYLNTWDYLGNGIVCTFIEAASSVSLVVRILLQKRRMRLPMNWKKRQKMAFQILSLSCLSLTIIFPQSLITVIQQVGGPGTSAFGSAINPYLFYLYTFVVFLLPFICLSSSSELRRGLWIFNRKRRRDIGPMTVNAVCAQFIVVKPRPS